MIAVVKNNFDIKSPIIQGPSLSCVIDEPNNTPDTTMRHLNIRNARNAEMYLFPSNYIAGMGCITNNVSSKLLDSNCDGTVFMYSQDGQLHIIMAELKSCQPGSGLSDAFKQLVYTFLKYYSLFSTSRGWNIDNNTIDFVIACSCSKNPKDLEAKMYSARNDLDLLGNEFEDGFKDFVVSIFTELYFAPQQKLELTFNELKMLEDFKLNEQIANKKFTLHLTTASTIVDDYADITFVY